MLHTSSTPIIDITQSSTAATATIREDRASSSAITAAGVTTNAYASVFLQYATMIFVPADQSMMDIHDPDAQFQSIRRVVHEHITMRRINPDLHNLGQIDLAYALKLSTGAINISHMSMNITIDMESIEDPKSRKHRIDMQMVSEQPHEHTHRLACGGAEGLTPPRTSTRRATSGARPARTSTDSLTYIDVQSLARDRLPRPITTDA